jgi:hypothetical protein
LKTPPPACAAFDSSRHASGGFSAMSKGSVDACLFGMTQPFHLVLEVEFAPFQFGDFEIGFVSRSRGFDFTFESRMLVLEAGQLR